MGLGRFARVASPAGAPPGVRSGSSFSGDRGYASSAALRRRRRVGTAAHEPRRQHSVRPLRPPAVLRSAGPPLAGGRPRPRIRPEQGASREHVAFSRREGRRRSRREPRQPPRRRECPAGERREHARPRRVAEGPLREPRRPALRARRSGAGRPRRAQRGRRGRLRGGGRRDAGASRRSPRRRSVAADDPGREGDALHETSQPAVRAVGVQRAGERAEAPREPGIRERRREDRRGNPLRRRGPDGRLLQAFLRGDDRRRPGGLPKALLPSSFGTSSTCPRSRMRRTSWSEAVRRGVERRVAGRRAGRPGKLTGRQNPTRVVRTPP